MTLRPDLAREYLGSNLVVSAGFIGAPGEQGLIRARPLANDLIVVISCPLAHSQLSVESVTAVLLLRSCVVKVYIFCL